LIVIYLRVRSGEQTRNAYGLESKNPYASSVSVESVAGLLEQYLRSGWKDIVDVQRKMPSILTQLRKGDFQRSESKVQNPLFWGGLKYDPESDILYAGN
jgi:hypothetical protein